LCRTRVVENNKFPSLDYLFYSDGSAFDQNVRKVKKSIDMKGIFLLWQKKILKEIAIFYNVTKVNMDYEKKI
jgi:hypothetical protein